MDGQLGDQTGSVGTLPNLAMWVWLLAIDLAAWFGIIFLIEGLLT